MNFLRRMVVVAVALFGANQVNADLITIDPDDYATGTNLTNMFQGASISWLRLGSGEHSPTRNDVYAADCGFWCWPEAGSGGFGDEDGLSWTGNALEFIQCETGETAECYGSQVLEILFDEPTDYIEILSTYIHDVTMIWAYDIEGNLLEHALSYQIGATDYHYAGLSALYRPESDIARVVAGSWASSSVILEVSYSVPEPGTLALLGIGLAGMGLSRRGRKA